jgi:dTDP-4-amino-4,6-dideoxygalactose transaminase
MLNSPFAPWPSFTDEEVDAVSSVMRSNKVNYWTGQECREFEKEFAQWSDAQHAIALSNGTLALDLALKVLGVGPGDEVVVTPRSFMASASCVVTAGAKPVFADVCRDTQNITAETIAAVLTLQTKAIICVHLAGWPCDMDAIMALANARNIKVIEDCAQAHGARYKGVSVGSFGHINAWSFCQDKIMTTGGEGGIVTTNDPELWSSAWSYKDHGKSFDAVYNRQHPPGFRWLHESFGTNWRMLEVQGVIGRIQVKRMKQWQEARKHNSLAILDAAKQCPALRIPSVPADIEHAWYRCYMFVKPEMLKSDWSRDRIVQEISSRGVPCFQGSCSEMYLEKAFQDMHLQPPQRLPVAMELGSTSIAFLVHPTLLQEQIDKTCAVLKEVMSLATA